MQSTRESIFSSTLRSFFKMFAGILGLLVAIFLVVVGLSFGEHNLKVPEKGELLVGADAEGGRKVLNDSSPVILKMKIKGIIGEGKLTTEKVEGLLLDVQDGAFKTERVKGLFLDINTPGGLSTDSAGIFHAIKVFKAKHKIPVYAYVDGLCASGGMYIAAVADQIYSTSSSIIGSIGVRMGPFFNFAEGMEKIGIKSLTLTDGKGKDTLNPFRPWEKGEEASIQAIIEDDYKNFVDHMTKARPRLDKEKLINVYGAQVFDAEKAKEYGYIDVAGATYNQILGELVKAAGIKPDVKYQVLEIKTKESILREMLENKSSLLKGKIVHSFDTGTHFKPEMSGKLLYLYMGPAQ